MKMPILPWSNHWNNKKLISGSEGCHVTYRLSILNFHPRAKTCIFLLYRIVVCICHGNRLLFRHFESDVFVRVVHPSPSCFITQYCCVSSRHCVAANRQSPKYMHWFDAWAFVFSFLRLRRNTHWHLHASFDSLLFRAGLGHLGKGWQLVTWYHH